MSYVVREFHLEDLEQMTAIWNRVVEDGIAFPQTDALDLMAAKAFFSSQNRCAVAADSESGRILGLSILHPNNVGRCGHIANASFAVDANTRGKGVGEALVQDCLRAAPLLGFSLLQFNAVVRTNAPARALYQKLGFVELGTIPGGFRMKDGHFEDIVLYYHTL